MGCSVSRAHKTWSRSFFCKDFLWQRGKNMADVNALSTVKAVKQTTRLCSSFLRSCPPFPAGEEFLGERVGEGDLGECKRCYYARNYAIK